MLLSLFLFTSSSNSLYNLKNIEFIGKKKLNNECENQEARGRKISRRSKALIKTG